MKNNDQFFSNVECRYFPCHENIAAGDFNCLFCYCPLYLLGDHCNGNFQYTGESENVKCCSKCTFPHEPSNYDFVVARLKEIIRSHQKDSVLPAFPDHCVRPNGGLDLADMSTSEQIHADAGLADSAADGKGNPVFQ